MRTVVQIRPILKCAHATGALLRAAYALILRLLCRNTLGLPIWEHDTHSSLPMMPGSVVRLLCEANIPVASTYFLRKPRRALMPGSHLRGFVTILTSAMAILFSRRPSERSNQPLSAQFWCYHSEHAQLGQSVAERKIYQVAYLTGNWWWVKYVCVSMLGRRTLFFPVRVAQFG
jgi:hypothetical protein